MACIHLPFCQERTTIYICRSATSCCAGLPSSDAPEWCVTDGLLCSCAQELRELDLSETPVGDEDLRSLRLLPRLRALRLNRQPARQDVSNAGLAEIAQLPRLACLELQGNCAVTARGGPCANFAPESLVQRPFAQEGLVGEAQKGNWQIMRHAPCSRLELC